jgi:hypothetical protein
MFEDKKWSDVLKEKAATFLRIFGLRSRAIIDLPALELAALIEMALEEGRQEVLEDPSAYEFVSRDEVREREPPDRDEDG